jgi:hypothetical protein
MYRFLLAFFLVSISTNALQAQTFQVSGWVVNAANGKPLADASVFINNASKGTLTNKDGEFVISNISNSTFELVISFVSFETVVINITPENINKRFRVQMAAKENELPEVVVGPIDKDGWKNWGQSFTDYFIGLSDNAKQCIIKNPAVLRFRYNKNERILRVTAVDKLVIENNALGLSINYQLEEFILNNKIGMTSFTGYSSFSTMTSKRSRKMAAWRAKRREAYDGSMMHFMRAFYQNKTVQEGFELRQLIRLYKEDSATLGFYNRIMSGDLTAYDTSKFSSQLMKSTGFGSPVIFITGRQPLPVDSIRIDNKNYNTVQLFFSTNIMVDYKKEAEKPEYALQQNPSRKPRPFQSSIIFQPNAVPVVVDKDGNYADPLNVMAEGYWGWEKMAELLPSDYEIGE